eukprot:CAMPEP_0197191560 /NCGR_PEP_ID=MMETSP1423-20130617/23613_1 /TAXON_ID=476441 /ORGANISM="Pseudo-nitzschia heimii, Strain UNC1101" /LENGTH=523 /DNA_ID=CAMNT_0042644237 /DNA_START=96 /DNA_END=1667 /DNA_ORIENTATION=-
MVIANSDSTTTLVSLNGQGKTDHVADDRNIIVDRESGLLRYVEPSTLPNTTLLSNTASPCFPYGGDPTELLISLDDDCSSRSDSEHAPLYLPLSENHSWQEQSHDSEIDEYIVRNYYNINGKETELDSDPDQPQLAQCMLPGAQKLQESRATLLASKGRGVSQQRLLYVAQGERANATSEQYDVLMSDKATTCHILAFRSRIEGTRSMHCAGDLPLTSLTHLDGTQYEQCIRVMIQEHIDYHHRSYRNKRKRTKFGEEEKKSDDCREVCDVRSCSRRDNITIDIHVMGGFNDVDSSSSDITEWLTRLLAQIAHEFRDERAGVRMVVKTLVVSSSNNEVDDCNNDSPIGRGLGIDLRTGTVFLTDIQNNDSGPVPILRSVRLWSRSHLEPHRLSVVHTISGVEDLWRSLGLNISDTICKHYSLFWVEPFRLRLAMDADALLRLPDKLLLRYTSTSPDVEDAGFCEDVRAAMTFLKQHCDIMKDDGRSYFGERFDKPMVFAFRHRSNFSNDAKTQREEGWEKLSL